MNDTTLLFADTRIAMLCGCALVATVVFALMLHSIATFRRTPSGGARPRQAAAEVFWALVPIVIVIAMAAPAVRALVAPHNGVETAQQIRPATGPALAGEIPQKAFNDSSIPL